MKSVPDSVVPDRHQTGTVLCSAGPAPNTFSLTGAGGALTMWCLSGIQPHHGVIWVATPFVGPSAPRTTIPSFFSEKYVGAANC